MYVLLVLATCNCSEANVSAARLDDAVVRIISQLYRNGIMEHPSNYNVG